MTDKKKTFVQKFQEMSNRSSLVPVSAGLCTGGTGMLVATAITADIGGPGAAGGATIMGIATASMCAASMAFGAVVAFNENKFHKSELLNSQPQPEKDAQKEAVKNSVINEVKKPYTGMDNKTDSIAKQAELTLV